MYDTEPNTEERIYAELRRKVRQGELLSTATEKLLRNLRFSGRLCVVVQDGCIMRSGYEEGYFSRRKDDRLFP